MSREIKFRIWGGSLGPKRMAYPKDLIQVQVRSEFKDSILMQYTGLKDRLNNELWEGDLIRNETGRICEIKWHNESGQWDAVLRKTAHYDSAGGFSPGAWCYSVTKIGNIYENPELLEEKK